MVVDDGDDEYDDGHDGLISYFGKHFHSFIIILPIYVRIIGHA